MRRIAPAALKAAIQDRAELAILDAREEGEFGTSHLFWAVPCPLSRAEATARRLLPRLSARIVVTDDGRGLAERLALYLEGLGATDVAVLDGGTPAWAAAGFVLFSGVNVPSKAFGEWVEHHYGTESVDPPELKSWLDQGRKMVVLDSRPLDEYRRMSIPTGINVPGGELVYRFGDLVPDPDTLVVVNCAGRTRSILGAESLRRAGVPNRVVALRNGTMGWELAGFTCDRGRTDRYPEGTPRGAAEALSRADAFAQASGVRFCTLADLAAFPAEAARTLYLLDVRDPAEFAAGHVPGAVSAPGGQLVQATDRWIAVRGARIVLADDTGTRARMTAAWLRQMGHAEVFVLADARDGASETGSSPDRVPEAEAIAAPLVGPDAVDGAAVVDLSRSIAFRESHIPGALWGIRTRLAALAPRLPRQGRIVVCAPDPAQARLAVPELRALTAAEVAILDGGLAAWREAGRPVEADRHTPPDEACADVYLRPYDRNEGVEEAMKAYLSWEIDLVREIARDGTVRFGASA